MNDQQLMLHVIGTIKRIQDNQDELIKSLMELMKIVSSMAEEISQLKEPSDDK